MAVTTEEQAIRVLPPKLQKRMAVLCLSGWRFEYSTPPAMGEEWQAKKLVCREYFGPTLHNVLMQMNGEYCHIRWPMPDAPNWYLR